MLKKEKVGWKPVYRKVSDASNELHEINIVLLRGKPSNGPMAVDRQELMHLGQLAAVPGILSAFCCALDAASSTSTKYLKAMNHLFQSKLSGVFFKKQRTKKSFISFFALKKPETTQP